MNISLLVRVLVLISICGLCSFCDPSRAMQGIFPMHFGSASQEKPTEVCVVTVPEIREASGIARSLSVQDAVWIHNDSGDTPRLFLVSFTGTALAILDVNGVEAIDWEDMCSFQADGEHWLLVGDIGDNGRQRGKSSPVCRLLLLKEPALEIPADSGGEPQALRVDATAVIEFDFPDGPSDCESLAVDTTTQEILLVTKTDPLNCRLYRLPLNLKPGRSRAHAEPLAKVRVPYATAMDVSPDGTQLAIVNLFSGALIRRSPEETWQTACEKPAVVLTLPPRSQGETVCFELDGKSLLLNSEGINQPLWRVRLPD